MRSGRHKWLGGRGAKVAGRGWFRPGGRVGGRDKPAMLKPVPEALAAEIVMLAVPELLSVMVCVPLVPASTFQKLKLEGLAETAASVPLPVRPATLTLLYAFLLIDTLPHALPAPAGANSPL